MTTSQHTIEQGGKWVNARVAGILYLVIIAFGLFNEVVVRFRRLEPGDAAATAENIRESEWLFRIGFTANLVLILGEVVLTVILYLLFRSVSRTLSLLAAVFRLVVVAITGLNLLNMFAALVVLDSGPGQPESLALLFLDLHQYGYGIAMTFFGLNCLVMGYLLAKSSHAPRTLGILLGVAGLGYLTNSFTFFLVPDYDGSAMPLLLAPAIVAESWFCLHLLRKGGGVDEWDERP
jgi:hypothetical protein